MTTRVRSFGLIAFGAFLGASQLFGTTIPPGATPCGANTFDAYVALGEIGCSLGGVFDASAFQFTASAGAPLGAGDITVTPTVTTDLNGTVVLIDFNISGNFSNNTSGPIEYTIDYILDPARPTLNGASIALDPSGVLTENICSGGVFNGVTCLPNTAFTSVLVATGALPNASTAFPLGVSIVDYHIVLDLQPGDSAGGFDSGTITGLGEEESTVPEPGAGPFASAGLIGLLAFGSRTKLRKVFGKFLS